MIKIKKRKSLKMLKQSGQAALVILLLMAIASTIGLIMSRNVAADLQMTKIQEESTRAFSAAEAGLEGALYSWRTGGEIPTSFDLETGAVAVSSEKLGENAASFTFPNPIDNGDFEIVWLTTHAGDSVIDQGGHYPGSSQVKICWESEAALEMVLFYKSAGEYKTQRWAFDSDAAGHGNNFSNPGSTGCLGLPVDATLNLPAGTPLFLLAKAHYGSTSVGVEAVGDNNFPSQGLVVTSTGEVVSGDDQIVSRRLRIFQTWDLPPLVFLEPLFSSGSVRTLE